MKVKHNKQAFTLIEMIIVLALVSVLLLIGFFPVKTMIASYQEQQFWRTFNQAWTKTAITAERKGCVAEVAFHSKEIEFSDYAENTRGQKRHSQIITLPPSLQVLTKFAYADFYKNGGTKFMKVVFYSKLHQVKYTLIPQVGYGGRYRLEVTR